MAVKARRGRPARRRHWLRALALLAAIPAAYLVAALGGSLIPVNRHWQEPAEGITVYLADNGIHADIVMPVAAGGVDWTRFLDRSDVPDPPHGARWVAFGMGERQVYLNTPTWADLKLRTAIRAMTRGERVVHVEWVGNPAYSARALRLRPEEYRRLFAAIRASFRDGRAQLIAGRHYGRSDAFYLGNGHANAVNTCNQWAASRLRLAGVEAPLWSPFVQGLTWRYRPTR